MGMKGKGDMTEFVESWNIAISAYENTRVVQEEAVFPPASMTGFDDKVVISFR